MRIISGKLKGRSISFLKSDITRPLKDSVRENIFNILTHSNLINVNLKKSSILDLYSGIGSFGLECISRGANNITFVEQDKIAAETLNKNLLNLSVGNKALVVVDEVSNFINSVQANKYDIIFFDPPFAKNDYVNELKMILKKKIYSTNHIVIIHREKKTSDNLRDTLNSVTIKNYGRSKIIFGKF